jgi:hypothetical protein
MLDCRNGDDSSIDLIEQVAMVAVRLRAAALGDRLRLFGSGIDDADEVHVGMA